MSNKTSVSFRIDETMTNMVEALKQNLGYNSNPAVFQEALRQMYKRQFPSYSGKPTPMPVQAGATQARTVAKARVQNKVALKQEEEAEIIENGKLITHLLSGRVVNLASGIDQVACAFRQMDNSPKTRELTNPIFFREMHERGVWSSDAPIETNDLLQTFLLEHKFRDLKLDAPEDKLTKKLKSIATAMSLGIERGEVTPEDFSVEVLISLFIYMDKYEVDTADLKAEMEEKGFAPV